MPKVLTTIKSSTRCHFCVARFFPPPPPDLPLPPTPHISCPNPKKPAVVKGTRNFRERKSWKRGVLCAGTHVEGILNCFIISGETRLPRHKIVSCKNPAFASKPSRRGSKEGYVSLKGSSYLQLPFHVPEATAAGLKLHRGFSRSAQSPTKEQGDGGGGRSVLTYAWCSHYQSMIYLKKRVSIVDTLNIGELYFRTTKSWVSTTFFCKRSKSQVLVSHFVSISIKFAFAPFAPARSANSIKASLPRARCLSEFPVKSLGRQLT